MEYQKVYSENDGSVNIKCPSCNAKKVIPHYKLLPKHKFSVKCRCGHVFKIQAELRKLIRKEINFDCIIMLSYRDRRWGHERGESDGVKMKPINGRITNISLGGIGVKIDGDIPFKENDQIIVIFNLDNTASTKIEKKAEIKRIKDDYLACAFFESDKYDKDLKFYFL